MVQALFIMEVIVAIGCKQEVDFAFFRPIYPEEAQEVIKSSLFSVPLHFYCPYPGLKSQETEYYPCFPVNKPGD
jgi:hypothetical protein